MPFRIKANTDAVTRARVLAGYTISGASRLAGCTATHLGYVETGKRGASPSLLKRLAELYGVPMTDLFTEVEVEQGAA